MAIALPQSWTSRNRPAPQPGPLAEWLDRIAIHEAGHAVAGLAMGYRAVWLQREPTGGRCWQEQKSQTPWHALVISLAGEAAELMYFPELTPQEVATTRAEMLGACFEFKSDAEQVSDALERLKIERGDNVDTLRHAGERAAAAILRKHSFIHKCLWLKLARLEDLKGPELHSVVSKWDFRN